VAAAGGQHPVVRHGDRLHSGPAAGGEQPVHAREVGGPVPLADCFDHLHGEDHVVPAGGLAVVAQLDVDPAGGPGGHDPPAGGGVLGGRDGQCRHPGAAVRGGDRQGAPAGADFQHRGAGPGSRAVQQGLDLAALRGGERVAGRE
jgi:hypothetical protein